MILSVVRDGGLELVLHKEKNNQGGAFFRHKHEKTSSRRIPIPPDSSNNEYTPVNDILFYLSKVPDSELVDPFFRETYKGKKDLDEYDYSEGILEENTNDIEQDYEIEIPETQANQILEAQTIQIHEAQANQVLMAQATEIPTTHAIEVPRAQESDSFTTEIPTAIQVPSQIQNTNKARTSKPSKLKSYSQAHPYSSVTAPFKPPYLSNSPLLTSYGKRRKPLSAVNNIIIQLPPGTSSQSYDLKINLKIN
ncbi:hypothetical protein C2G38_2028489 [Gigaspora rosea]|uniref:Uncharacterized protein n=1 Tax=Gigaspora rosea TaxID=44941 RepID=A0A397W884_9GLOM|nr:hypothetical protein C2G38_2028489 [Gigaspora rosea]